MGKQSRENENTAENTSDGVGVSAKKQRLSIIGEALEIKPPFSFKSTKNQKVQADVGGVANFSTSKYRRYVNRTKARSTVEEA